MKEEIEKMKLEEWQKNVTLFLYAIKPILKGYNLNIPLMDADELLTGAKELNIPTP